MPPAAIRIRCTKSLCPQASGVINGLATVQRKLVAARVNAGHDALCTVAARCLHFPALRSVRGSDHCCNHRLTQLSSACVTIGPAWRCSAHLQWMTRGARACIAASRLMTSITPPRAVRHHSPYASHQFDRRGVCMHACPAPAGRVHTRGELKTHRTAHFSHVAWFVPSTPRRAVAGCLVDLHSGSACCLRNRVWRGSGHVGIP